VVLGEKGTAVDRVGEVTFCCGVGESDVLVVIVRGCEAVVEPGAACAVGDREVGEPTVGADLAWKVGLVVVRARKAEKKFEKKGRWVGAMVAGRARSGDNVGSDSGFRRMSTSKLVTRNTRTWSRRGKDVDRGSKIAAWCDVMRELRLVTWSG